MTYLANKKGSLLVFSKKGKKKIQPPPLKSPKYPTPNFKLSTTAIIITPECALYLFINYLLPFSYILIHASLLLKKPKMGKRLHNLVEHRFVNVCEKIIAIIGMIIPCKLY